MNRLTRVAGEPLRSLTLTVCLGLAACGGGSSWFVDGTANARLDFRYESGDRGDRWLPTIMGGGVALFDYDGDGDLDVYFTNGNDDPLAMDASGPQQNRLFRQRVDGTFEDATSESGLGDRHYGMGVATGDIDNDGDIDVFVTNYGPDQLYLNAGDGTFENATERFAVAVPGFSASATFCDYDRDGFLDLYVTRYLEFDRELRCFDPAGRRDYCGPDGFAALPDVLLRNEGGVGFRDVSGQSGIGAARGHGLGVICEDLTGDGWPDFLVANDGDANHLWVNDGDGSFEEQAIPLGVAFNQHGSAEAGMGVLAADLDGDGLTDVFMTHLHEQTNTLYRSLEGGGFEDATGRLGLGTASIAFTGFGTAAVDLQLDGRLDLVIANGRVRSHGVAHVAAIVSAPWNRLAEPNQVFVGGGRFVERTGELCPVCTAGEISRGLAVGDVDEDGDTDVVVVNINSAARLYRNESPRSGRWLRVLAVDPELRRVDIGARVRVSRNGMHQSRTQTSGFSYLSSSQPDAVFGVTGAGPVRIGVTWSDGSSEDHAAPCLDCRVRITRGRGIERL